MTKTQEITEKLQSGLSVPQLIKQGYKRGLAYKIKRGLQVDSTKHGNSDCPGVSAGIPAVITDVNIENDPEIMALKKELRKAELERQLSEIKVPIGLESRIEALEEKTEKLNDFNDLLFEEHIDIQSILGCTPLTGLRSEFECKCGVKGFLGLNVHCTVCGKETSYGWYKE